jgi:hypothetical protein
MGRRGPAGLSFTERADMWSRWKAGYHVREIARVFGRDHGSIRGILLQRGGIAPRLRTRALVPLTLTEREDISRGIAAGESGRAIAERLGRAVSTVCREIGRYGGRDAYRASKPDAGAWQAALRPKACLLALNRTLRNLVASKLSLEWSPEQISGWLRDEFPDEGTPKLTTIHNGGARWPNGNVPIKLTFRTTLRRFFLPMRILHYRIPSLRPWKCQEPNTVTSAIAITQGPSALRWNNENHGSANRRRRERVDCR